MEQRRWCGAGERRIAATSRHSAPRLSDIRHGELHTSHTTRPRESRILLPKQRCRESKDSKDPDHQEEEGDQAPLDHDERQKRGAAKLAKVAYPHHDDVAISDRSRSYGVEDSKPTPIR